MSLSPSLFDKETLCILTAFGTGTAISVSLYPSIYLPHTHTHKIPLSQNTLTAFGTGTCISVSLAAAAAAALTAWPVVTGTAGSSSFLPEGGK